MKTLTLKVPDNIASAIATASQAQADGSVSRWLRESAEERLQRQFATDPEQDPTALGQRLEKVADLLMGLSDRLAARLSDVEFVVSKLVDTITTATNPNAGREQAEVEQKPDPIKEMIEQKRRDIHKRFHPNDRER